MKRYFALGARLLAFVAFIPGVSAVSAAASPEHQSFVESAVRAVGDRSVPLHGAGCCCADCRGGHQEKPHEENPWRSLERDVM